MVRGQPPPILCQKEANSTVGIILWEGRGGQRGVRKGGEMTTGP